MTVRDARIAALSGARQRPPYDDTSVARAIRDGIDMTGRRMNPGMPRYALDDDEMQALTAYLKTLSANSSPGVTDDKIHFATVIQPGVGAAKRRAMLDVLHRLFRGQERRAALASEAGAGRVRRTGPDLSANGCCTSGSCADPATPGAINWRPINREQPVFALIGGLGTASWRPIHEFSERFEIPCIFPQTDLPVVDGPGFYTVYLSKGIELEAKALAKYLQEQGERGPVTQILPSR